MLFAMGAAKLSDAFTTSRKMLPQNYLNSKENRSSYLLYFTITNFAKVIKALDEIKKSPSGNLFKEKEQIKILDLGSGPATASLAASHFFKTRYPNVKLSIEAVDQNREILKDAQSLFGKLGSPNHHFHTSLDTIHYSSVPGSIRKKNFDLIIAANIFNEMGDLHKQFELCKRLIEENLQNGFMIILDVATQKSTRTLMELRDLLLDKCNIKIISPCLHQEPCPMLKHNDRDWCHFYLNWDCPKVIRDVDSLLDIKHNYLKMAYLIIQKDKKCEDAPGFRVVSSPLLSKGKTELLLCGVGRLTRITRLDRDYSEKNFPLPYKNSKGKDYIQRGDIVEVSDHTDKITRDTQINITERFSSVKD